MGVTNMEHIITEFKEWPKGLELCYHDWVVKASKNEITEKLGFGPTKEGKDGQKFHYQWNCNLNNGEYFFTLYDMDGDYELGEDDVTEFHIGFKEHYDDIHNFFPNTLEALNMIEALGERDFDIDHSETWKCFHNDGVLDQIESYIKQKMIFK